MTKIKLFRDALEWALGMKGDFPARQEGQGAYYWRKELAQRAGLIWNGRKYVIDKEAHGKD